MHRSPSIGTGRRNHPRERAPRAPHGRARRRRLAGASLLLRLCFPALPLLACAAPAVTGCGGDAVVDPGGGGAGGTSSSSTSSSSSSSSGGVCQEHADCPPGEVCLFGPGTCAPSCEATGFDPCGPGLVCDACATSSCPGCENCLGACVPASPGQCDDHDDCPAAELCIYGTGTCAPSCDPSMPACPTPDLVCNPCATGSCPGCDDCLGACTKSF